MGIRPREFVVASVLALATLAWPQWSLGERSGLSEALRIGNLEEPDLAWDRQPFEDKFRPKAVRQALDQPIESANDFLNRAERMSTSSAGALLREIIPITGLEEPAPEGIKTVGGGEWKGPEALRTPVRLLMGQITHASIDVRAALEGISDQDRRRLIESLPSLMSEEFSPQFDFVTQKPMPLAEALGLLEKVDINRIIRAASLLADSVDQAVRSIREANADLKTPVEMKLNGRTVRIFGKGDDVHKETDASLTIDLGGNDRYLGRHAAGVGYASVLLDLDGDDVYEPRDLSIGSGLLGIGISRDESGNDVYRTNSLSLGCGLVGVGLHIDVTGNDRYESRVLSQGFAAFGTGVLLDAKGTDFYDIDLYGQGAARTMGYGMLIDRQGRDVYRAGGSALNSPLFSDVHYSFAQGFGMGYREDSSGTSGGVGLLLDREGDDHYLAETYAQAASYWFGLGVLWDRSGNDTYSAYHYAQSSAMHCTATMLFDLAGDDAYSLKFGAGHSIGHDYGVAVFLDRAGNDVYAARDSNPAVGNANGLAIFIEGSGDDRYAGPPGRGNAARGTGSLGIFVDLSGQDRYREGLADAAAAVTSSWGVAYDVETPRQPAATGIGSRPEPPVVGSLPMPDEAEMAEIYRRATQWGVGTAQAEVENAMNRLIGIGMPAMQWMLDRELGRAGRLQLRAFTGLLTAIGTPARKALAEKMLSGNQSVKQNGLSIAVEARVAEVAPLVPGLMDVPALKLAAVRAAGALQSRESVAALQPLTRQPGNLALAAMVSLAQIGEESAFATAEVVVLSSSLPMRRAALALLAKFPLRATDSATRLLGEGEERKSRIGLEILGAVGSETALGLIAERLWDPSPGIRIQALIELNGRCPEEKRLTLIGLRSDPDPAVRAVAARIDPGR